MRHEYLHKGVKDCAREVKSILSIGQNVGESIEMIRNTRIVDRSIIYFYVVDDNDNLLGIIKTRDLLMSDPSTPIKLLINTKIRTIKSSYTMYDALMLMQKYHLIVLPVVENGKFIGILDIQNYFEESLELDSEKKRFEAFQSLGISLQENVKSSTLEKYAYRVPWILCNMIGGILCAVVSSFYKVILIQLIVLAMFTPLVLSLSESISMQAMTQSLHLISGGGLTFFKKVFFYIAHETKLFLLTAVTCGVIVGLLSLLWGGWWVHGIVIGISIFISITITAIIGAIVPLALHALKLDPKIASGPVVLMLADVVTIIVYLTLAFFTFYLFE